MLIKKVVGIRFNQIFLGTILLVSFALNTAHSFQCHNLFLDHRIDFTKPPSPQVLTQQSRLRLMAWNLKDFFVKSAGYSVERTRQKNPSPKNILKKSLNKVQQIRRIVEETRPEILVLNEVIGEHSTRSLDRNNHYHHITNTPKDSRGIQTTFMVAKSLFAGAELYKPRSQNEGVKLARGLPTLLLRQKTEFSTVNKNKDPDLIVMGVHLKAPLGPDKLAHKQMKEAEIELVLGAVAKLEKDFPNSPILIAGDFNLELPSGVTTRRLRSAMNMAFEGKVRTEDYNATHSVFDWAPGGAEPIFQSAKAIDHFVSNHQARRMLLGSRVYQFKDKRSNETLYSDGNGNHSINPLRFRQQSEQNPSDHKPLVIEIDMTR